MLNFAAVIALNLAIHSHLQIDTHLEACTYTSGLSLTDGSGRPILLQYPPNGNVRLDSKTHFAANQAGQWISFSSFIGATPIASIQLTKPRSGVQFAIFNGVVSPSAPYTEIELLDDVTVYVDDCDGAPVRLGQRSRQVFRKGVVRTGAYGTRYALETAGSLMYFRVIQQGDLILLDDSKEPGLTIAVNDPSTYCVIDLSQAEPLRNAKFVASIDHLNPADYNAWFSSSARCPIQRLGPSKPPATQFEDENDRKIREYKKRWPECAD